MTRIDDLLAAGPTLSFEFFPPKTDEAERQLEKAINELAALEPSFVSVTYGALGSTRDRTKDIVVRFNHDQLFPCMAHLTCVGHTRDEIVALLDEYQQAGVRNILALAGDPPADGSDPGGDFTYALELVDLIREHPGDFAIGVAAQPEMHPRSTDRASDRRHFAAKLEAADFAITNFFFRLDDYLELVEEVADAGSTKPILPGIMPAISVPGLVRMSDMNGTRIPPDLLARYRAAEGDPDAVRRVAVDSSTELGQALVDAGAPGLHLYALNRSVAVMAIVANMGLRP